MLLVGASNGFVMVCELVSVGLGGIISCITAGVFSSDATLFAITLLMFFGLLMFINNTPLRLALGFGIALLYLLVPVAESVFMPFFIVGLVVMAWVIVGGFGKAHKDSQ